MLGEALLGEELLGEELLELEPLRSELLPLVAPELLAAPAPELLEPLGDALLPLEALPFGQSAPTQFDEPPVDALPCADEEALPDAEVLALGVDGVVVVLAPVVGLPPAPLPLPALLPLDEQAAHTNAAATAAPMVFRSIRIPPWLMRGTTGGTEANKVPIAIDLWGGNNRTSY